MAVARCPVARLMRPMGPKGVTRGKEARTRVPERGGPCPEDLVNRQFVAPRPNLLWVADFVYVATCQGVVDVAFVVGTFARRIVGWRVSRTAHAGFVLDALEQAPCGRRPHRGTASCITAIVRGQYVSIRCTGRLVEAGIEPSLGRVGDIPPAEAEAHDDAAKEAVPRAARPTRNSLRQRRTGSGKASSACANPATNSTSPCRAPVVGEALEHARRPNSRRGRPSGIIATGAASSGPPCSATRCWPACPCATGRVVEEGRSRHVSAIAKERAEDA